MARVDTVVVEDAQNYADFGDLFKGSLFYHVYIRWARGRDNSDRSYLYPRGKEGLWTSRSAALKLARKVAREHKFKLLIKD